MSEVNRGVRGGGGVSRWSSTSGILFVGLFALGSVLMGRAPGAHATENTIVSFYSHYGNQIEVELAFLLGGGLCVVFFVWFLADLVARLQRAQADSSVPSTVVAVAGGIFATLILAGFATGTIVAETADDTTRFHVDPNVARLFADLAYWFSVASAFAAAPLLIAVSITAMRTRFLPRPLGWAGFVAALGYLAGFAVISGPFVLWVLLVSVYLTWRGRASGAMRHSYISGGPGGR